MQECGHIKSARVVVERSRQTLNSRGRVARQTPTTDAESVSHAGDEGREADCMSGSRRQLGLPSTHKHLRRPDRQRPSQRLQRPCARCGCSVAPQSMHRSTRGDQRFTRTRFARIVTGHCMAPPWGLEHLSRPPEQVIGVASTVLLGYHTARGSWTFGTFMVAIWTFGNVMVAVLASANILRSGSLGILRRTHGKVMVVATAKLWP